MFYSFFSILVNLIWKYEVTGIKWLESTNFSKAALFLFHVSSRFTPKNLHQRPTVALLCGPHVQGAQGISCGRHLANHEVEVILFLPNFVKMLDSVTSELTLFNKTGGKQVSSIKGEHIFLLLIFTLFLSFCILGQVKRLYLVVFKFFPLTPQTFQTPQWT